MPRYMFARLTFALVRFVSHVSQCNRAHAYPCFIAATRCVAHTSLITRASLTAAVLMGRNERPTVRPSDRPSVRRTVRPTVVDALVVWIVDYVRELLAIRAQALEQLRRN